MVNATLINICHLNIRSLICKFQDFSDFILLSDYDVVCLSETWLSPNFDESLISIKGYKLTAVSRDGRRGGEAIYTRDFLKVSVLTSHIDCDLEYIWVCIKLRDIKLALGCLYRPPNGNFRNFLTSFEEVYDTIHLDYANNICLGDFNINMLEPNNHSSIAMIDSIDILRTKTNY